MMLAELPLLTVDQLSYRRQNQWLFDGCSFTLQRGKVLQILGPNGSGKTSLLKLLLGLLIPTAGECCWQTDCEVIYIGHQLSIKAELTPLENLLLNAPVESPSQQQALQALSSVGLTAVQHQRCATLSQGQKQKVALARLFCRVVDVWVLDEPLSAIDKETSSVIQLVMREHLERGGGIILTSHQPIEIATHAMDYVELTNYARP